MGRQKKGARNGGTGDLLKLVETGKQSCGRGVQGIAAPNARRGQTLDVKPGHREGNCVVCCNLRPTCPVSVMLDLHYPREPRVELAILRSRSRCTRDEGNAGLLLHYRR